MERLTKKISKTIQDKYSLGSYLYYDFANADEINKLLNKLGELEDLMELYHCNSIDDLKTMLENWDKLKEWIDKSGCFLDDGSLSGDVVISIYAILDKMQELELKGDE